jgi:ABC-2 type transport system ATP-binding protein
MITPPTPHGNLMSAPAISVDGVSKYFRLYHEKNQYLKSALLHGRRSRYDEFWALKDVSFDIPQGSTFGIIGANGSGKSTLLKCLAGILTPDHGSVTMNGRVAALLELGAGFHPDLSGIENIFLNGSILGMTRKEMQKSIDKIIDFAGLGEFIDTPVKNYSSGMVVRLGFSVAINVDPEILLIDEVLAVGDASFQRKCLEKIEDFRADGKTVVIVSHGVSEVARLCDQVAWIQKGELQRLGEPYEVVSQYMGETHTLRKNAEGEIGKRWGEGDIEVEKIQLLDQEGNESTLFQTSHSMTIRIHCQSTIADIESVISLRITNLHGTDLWGTSTKSKGFELVIPRGYSYVDLTIDDLPLLEDTYDISLAVTDVSGTHEYDHWERRTRFEVRQTGFYDAGIVTINSHWENGK